MYIRDAEKREEVWLLDRLDEFGFEDPAFRSRDYVFAIDEETGHKAGFGRLRVHSVEDEPVCELTCIGVLEDWRGQGVGAHVVERLVELARDQGAEMVYSFTTAVEYCRQFGFEPTDVETLSERLQTRFETVTEREPAAEAVGIATEDFTMPRRLRRRFRDEEGVEPSERPEDFGIDPETASYKYDTGRR